MIVPPPSLELERDADAPLTRESVSAQLRRHELDDQEREQRSRHLERVLEDHSRS